jgi:hypothetical protein
MFNADEQALGTYLKICDVKCKLIPALRTRDSMTPQLELYMEM